MEKPMPKCPYCGEQMKPDRTFKSMLPIGVDVSFWFLCGECCARSPMMSTQAAAYAAAMKRWVEPNRVLTLDEVIELDPDGATCLEEKSTGNIEVMLNSEIIEEFNDLLREEGMNEVKRAYGKYARAWLRRPTDEERAAAGWVDEAGE